MNQIVVVVISICIFVVSLIVALKVVEKDKGEYECNTCKHKFEPAFKEIEIGNGISIYVDVTTGLIIGGEAFGD